MSIKEIASDFERLLQRLASPKTPPTPERKPTPPVEVPAPPRKPELEIPMEVVQRPDPVETPTPPRPPRKPELGMPEGMEFYGSVWDSVERPAPLRFQQQFPTASPKVSSSIFNAAMEVGIDPEYLFKQARQESSFRPDVKAPTSSATGLFQFINSTWLDMARKHGTDLGISKDLIEKSKTNTKAREELLNLRKDPELASRMAARFALENKKRIEPVLGRTAEPVDLYMAHFLGGGGARTFFRAMKSNPKRSAADVMGKRVADDNKNVFFKNGRERTLEEVYAFYQKRFN